MHRLLNQLVDLGAVERSDRRYRIGSRVFRLGRFWQPEPRDLAREWLPTLSARMRASLVLAVPVRTPDGRVGAALAAVLPAHRDPASTVAGLASTARTFSAALAGSAQSNRAG